MNDLREAPAFGPVLRQFRIASGLTQEELACRLGYNTANYVSCLEIGTRKPSVELLFKIAAALDVQASKIITEMEALQNGNSDRKYG